MKLSILQENLVQAVNTANRSASAKASLPILNHLLLSAGSGRLKISATNLEVGVNITTGAKVEIEGSLAVPARVLQDLVSTLPAGKVELSVEKGSLHLVAGNIEANIAGIEGSEFPAVPTFPESGGVSLPVGGFSEAVEAVAYAAAGDESRPVLTGVFWQVASSGMTLVATDGYRLAKKDVLLPEKVTPWQVVIPSRSLQEVAKILSELSSRGETPDQLEVALDGDQNQISFRVGAIELTSRLVAGTYPPFDTIIPKEEDAATRGIFSREELTQAVRLAAVFARDLGSVIKFKISPAGLELTANTSQVGDERTTLTGEISGEEVSVAFNSRYLLDALGHLGGSQVSFEIKSNLAPGVWRSVGDESLLVLVMPVRVQN